MILNNQIKQKVEPNNPLPSRKGKPETSLPILAELVRRDDGSYLLRPRLVDSALDTWISPKKAAQLIGIHGRSIYRLIDPQNPYLVHKRPLKSRCLISLSSVQAFIQATSDPDFWDDSLQQKALTDSVRKKMSSLRAF